MLSEIAPIALDCAVRPETPELSAPNKLIIFLLLSADQGVGSNIYCFYVADFGSKIILLMLLLLVSEQIEFYLVLPSTPH